jgi:quercetin dioxygenase-like cupin family protein
MKLENLRLPQEPDKSFIIHHETQSFSQWHHHPEYELVLILKGKGKRMVGDSIDQFKPNDLILVGSYLPHAWLCDREYNEHPEGFKYEDRLFMQADHKQFIQYITDSK